MKDAKAADGVLSYSYMLIQSMTTLNTGFGSAMFTNVTLLKVTIPLKDVDASRLSLTNDCGFGIKIVGVNGAGIGELNSRWRT